MKYVVNKTNIAYRFLGRILLERRGVVAVNEKDEKELLANVFFSELKERGAVSLTKDAPSSLSDKGAQIAAKDAEIKALREKVAEMEGRLAMADGTGRDTSTVLDSESPDNPETPEPKADNTKNSKKKED